MRAEKIRTRPLCRPLYVYTAAAVLLFHAVLFYVYTLYRVHQSPGGLLQAWAFIGSLFLLVLAAALPETLHRRRSWWIDALTGEPRPGLPWWRHDWLWLAAFLVVWIGVNQVRLDTRPGFFHGDEAMIVQYGLSTYLHPSGDARNAPVWLTSFQPYLSGVVRSLVRDLFPERPYYGPRLFSLIMGAATLALTFCFARLHFGRLAAWFAIALMGTSHVYIAFCRNALNNIDAAFLAITFALAWMGAWRSRRLSLALLAGIAVGMSYYTYQAALLVLPLMAVIAFVEYIRSPARLRRRWMLLFVAIAGFLVAAAPIHRYHRNFPDAMRFRHDFVFLLSQKNIEHHFDRTGARNLPQLLLRESWPAFGGSLLWQDTSSNYNYKGLPILDRHTLALFLLALAGALVFWRRRMAIAILLLWVLLTGIFGGLLAVAPPPPYAPRLLVAWPAVYTLCGIALAGLIVRTGTRLPRWGCIGLVVAAALWTGSISARHADHYYKRYLNDMEHPFYRWIPMGFMEWLRHLPADSGIVLFGDHQDQMYTSFLKLYDKGFVYTPVLEPTADIPPPFPGVPRTAYVVKLPRFRQAAARLEQAFPAAEVVLIRNPFFPDDPPTHQIFLVTPGESSPTENTPVDPGPRS